MKRLFEICDDCLGVIERLKQIDKDYVLMRNVDRGVFELHNLSQRGNSYCLSFAYEQIDERMIVDVLKTRVENSEALFREMEAENQKNRQRQIKQILNDFEEKIYDS
ncbi:MAG: hypothetical protein IJX00_03420 [Clostridia bacterium]|nr:hypothetical protein [Clostridia bacterium]